MGCSGAWNLGDFHHAIHSIRVEEAGVATAVVAGRDNPLTWP
jgi:hypothetical protein